MQGSREKKLEARQLPEIESLICSRYGKGCVSPYESARRQNVIELKEPRLTLYRLHHPSYADRAKSESHFSRSKFGSGKFGYAAELECSRLGLLCRFEVSQLKMKVSDRFKKNDASSIQFLGTSKMFESFAIPS
jgi:hypothetical protein